MALFYILGNLFNIWLIKTELVSPICFCVQIVMMCFLDLTI